MKKKEVLKDRVNRAEIIEAKVMLINSNTFEVWVTTPFRNRFAGCFKTASQASAVMGKILKGSYNGANMRVYS